MRGLGDAGLRLGRAGLSCGKLRLEAGHRHVPGSLGGWWTCKSVGALWEDTLPAEVLGWQSLPEHLLSEPPGKLVQLSAMEALSTGLGNFFSEKNRNLVTNKM